MLYMRIRGPVSPISRVCTSGSGHTPGSVICWHRVSTSLEDVCVQQAIRLLSSLAQGCGKSEQPLQSSYRYEKITGVRAVNCNTSGTVKFAPFLTTILRSLWCAYRVKEIRKILSYIQKARIKPLQSHVENRSGNFKSAPWNIMAWRFISPSTSPSRFGA